MNARFLNISYGVFFAVALIGLQGAAFGVEQECYPSVEAYMAETFGEHYADDENLIVTERTYGRQKFYVAADMTPGTNHSEVLFNKTEDNKFCIALSTSMMSKLTAVKFDAKGYPQKFVSIDQAPPGMPGHEVTYCPNVQRTAFYAAACKEVILKGNQQVKNVVPCSAMLGGNPPSK